DIRKDLLRPLQGAVTVLREPDRIARLIEEMRLQLADMRIAIDNENDRLPFRLWLSLQRHVPAHGSSTDRIPDGEWRDFLHASERTLAFAPLSTNYPSWSSVL